MLKHWLRDIAASPTKYGSRKENRRKAAQLAGRARKLADEIDHAEQSPPLPFSGSAAELWDLQVRGWTLPASLRGYAGYWEKRLSFENRVIRDSRTLAAS